jgi:hypothetical protein
MRIGKIIRIYAMSIRVLFSLFLLLFLCKATFTSAQDTRVSLQRNQLTLFELFNEIKQQSNINFGYNNQIDSNKRVMLTEQEGTIVQILHQALQDTGYTYRIVGTYIFIIPEPEKNNENNLANTSETIQTVVNTVAGKESNYQIVRAANPPSVAIVKEVDEVEKIESTTEPEAVETIVCENATQPDDEIILPDTENLFFTSHTFSGVKQPSRVALKTNLLYGATTTLNLGVEFLLNKDLTLDISGGWNPFVYTNNKKFAHYMVQPTLRYWIQEPFNGHFIGSSLMYANFNMGGLDLSGSIMPALAKYRYRGNAYNISFQYGHRWSLAPRWAIETTLNVIGYMYLDYLKFECGNCGKPVAAEKKHYLGPTNAAVSLIYVIR